MGDSNKKITSFKDLDAWKYAHQLAIIIYKITKNFPTEEQFGLTSQMRRCAISAPSNIAEGFNRQFKKEKIQFYSIASGSLAELDSQLLLAKDIGYINEKLYEETIQHIENAHRLTNGLIRSTKSWDSNS